MVRAVDDANFVRFCKLAAVAGGVGLLLVGASFVLEGRLWQITAGAATGLAFTVATGLLNAYRRRGPAEATPAATEKKARRGRAVVVIGTVVGALGLVPLRALHAEWFAAGFFIAFFAFLALMVSPLFWTRSSARPESSRRAQMTSVERSVSVRYE
jgi:cyanate permease